MAILIVAEFSSRLSRYIRVLEYLREPSDDPEIQRGLAAAHVIAQMTKKFRTIARLGLNSEATPQIKVIWHVAFGRKRQPFILPPLGMLKPIFGEWHSLAPALNEAVVMPPIKRLQRPEFNILGLNENSKIRL